MLGSGLWAPGVIVPFLVIRQNRKDSGLSGQVVVDKVSKTVPPGKCAIYQPYFVTLTVLSVAPYPVDTQQPMRHALSSGILSAIC